MWVSEVMLQQTQVATVIPYFERFMARFPTLQSLAAAPIDDVLHLWSGLGYYARARNLHRAANDIVDRFDGEFPLDMDHLTALPGVGRSTAGAVLALSTGQRQVILDGNVKRVLCRHLGIDGWPGERAVSNRLWSLAEKLTPVERVDEYTQAIMDLGATVCVRAQPACGICPVADDCLARRKQRTAQLPSRKPKREKPVRSVQMIMLRDRVGRVLLERRPPAGIWGGLWSFPECDVETDPATWVQDALGVVAEAEPSWDMLRHTFSHFHLDIRPVPMRATGTSDHIMEGQGRVWYNSGDSTARGFAAPVGRLLNELDQRE